jgi:hypothetical protein
MKHATRLSVLLAVLVLFFSGSSPSPAASSAQVMADPPPIATSAVATVPAVPVDTESPAAAPVLRPVEAISEPIQAQVVAVAPAAPAATNAAPAAAAAPDSRNAALAALYVSVVPAAERAALAGRYVIGYNLPGLNCGNGCTGLFSGQARSSFNAAFFTLGTSYQRNILAHEAAHAFGFLFIANYATPDWSASGGWQAQFHAAHRGFVRTYDAEAWAACVAWSQTGFNNVIEQVTGPCTAQAASLAVAQL